MFNYIFTIKNDYKMQKAFALSYGQRWNFLSASSYIFFNLKHSLLKKICNKKGHNFKDESYGNPDHGYESATCKRCGCHYHMNMY